MMRARKILVLTAAVGFTASISAWIGIKVGRPLYYSDGQEVVTGAELLGSGMLRWSSPEPDFEVPGRVRGRITQLPDGRVIYGQVVGEGRTDLVIYDPASAAQPARPVIELNSRGHDLAPAMGPSGRLYFASDRPAGAGGFDIYSASYRDGVFFAVRALPQGINSGLDETDPAVDAMGGQLVFVRRDPEVDDGENGTLVSVSLDDPASVEEVFARREQVNARRTQAAPIDRDPAFSPDGLGIYFVREQAGRSPVVMRSNWHRDHYVTPVAVEAFSQGGPFRGPAIVDGGFGIRLTTIGDPATVYHAAAQEVYPYWPGQWWLEWLLFSSALFFALILILLVLGSRWGRLDAVTKLILLSMLVHAVILLWASRMEIIRSFEPKSPGAGRVEVFVVANSANSGEAGSAEVRQDIVDVSRSLHFEGREIRFDAATPGTALLNPVSKRVTGETARPAYHPTRVTQDAKLTDRTKPVTLRTARSTRRQHERQTVRTKADTGIRTRVRAREHAAGQILVELPGVGVNRAAGFLSKTRAPLTKPGVARSLPLAQLPAVMDVALSDERSAPIVRAERVRSEAVMRPDRAATGSLAVASRSLPKPSLPAPAVVALERPSPTARSIVSAPTRRSLPRRVESQLESRIAVVDDQAVRDQIDPKRLVGSSRAAQAPPDRAVSKDLRPAEQQAVPLPVAQRRKPQDSAVGVMAPPGSVLARGEVRRDIDVRRPLPTRRGGALTPMAILSDRPQSASRTAPAARRAETKAFAAADLGVIRHAQRSHELERESTSVAQGRPTNLKPGSMVGRLRRRSVVAPGSGSVVPKAQDLASTVVDLEDLVQDPLAPRVRESVRPPLPTRTMSQALPSLRRDPALVGVDRPLVRQLDPGSLAHDFGVVPPGSFLARARRAVTAPAGASVITKLTPYANRFGANKQAALKKYGGDAATERAVTKGLDYLASVQNDDGTWGSPRRGQEKYGQVFVGKTGLCLLAFLGAGHTPASMTRHSEVARRAVVALLGTQIRGRHFGRSSSYSHGITTYALAECFALTKDEKLRAPLEGAVGWILANQQLGRDRRNRGGWGYFSPTLSPEDRFSRTSASAWQIMALKSARLSGIRVPDEALEASRQFLLNSYDKRYRYFLYSRDPERLRSEWRTLPASTPAALFCLQLFGMDPATDARLAAGADYILERAPRRYRKYSDDDFVLRGAGNVYFWYYGSLACFMAGGDTWDRWNAALKPVLIGGQSEDGSFRPIDTYADQAGDTQRDRSYTTSLCVLSLEVYYRYFTPLLKRK